MKISRYSEVIHLKLHLDTHWFLRVVNHVFIYEGNKIKGWNARGIKCIAQLEKLIKNVTLVTALILWGWGGGGVAVSPCPNPVGSDRFIMILSVLKWQLTPIFLLMSTASNSVWCRQGVNAGTGLPDWLLYRCCCYRAWQTSSVKFKY